jgi:hypothetical protein
MKKGSAKTAFLVVAGFLILFLIFVFFQFRALKKKVTLLSCDAIKQEITESLNKYKNDNPNAKFPPGTIIDIEELYRKGYLKDYQHCPQGGTYKINRYGEVYCTYHNPNLGE